MNHAERLARYLREQGPGAIHTSCDIAVALGTTRSIASTYLRRAERRGWVRPVSAAPPQHGGPGRRTTGAVLVRFTALPAVQTETVMVCPRCGLHPPRYYQARLQGHTPLCAGCHHAGNQATYRRRVRREKGGLDDLTPDLIERRFQHARDEIRRQRWTASLS